MFLNKEQEIAISNEIGVQDNLVVNIIEQIPEMQPFLNTIKSKEGDSVNINTDTCADILRHLDTIKEKSPKHIKIVSVAQKHVEKSNSLRWQLAMSGQKILAREAAKLSNPLLSEADLIQEGYIGLIHAANRYNPEVGVRFLTYAIWWVRARMKRAISDKGRLVRVPGGALEQLRNLRNAQQEFGRSGKVCDIDTLSSYVGIDRKRIEFLFSIENGSFTSTIVDEPGSPIFSKVKYEDATPEQMITDKEMLELIDKYFTHLLDTREQIVIRESFGLNGQDPKTLAQIGELLNLSRERIRQIRLGVLKKFRSFLDSYDPKLLQASAS